MCAGPIQDDTAQEKRQHRRRQQREHLCAHAPFAALRVPLELLAKNFHRGVVAHEPAIVRERLRPA